MENLFCPFNLVRWFALAYRGPQKSSAVKNGRHTVMGLFCRKRIILMADRLDVLCGERPFLEHQRAHISLSESEQRQLRIAEVAWESAVNERPAGIAGCRQTFV